MLSFYASLTQIPSTVDNGRGCEKSNCDNNCAVHTAAYDFTYAPRLGRLLAYEQRSDDEIVAGERKV